MRLMPSFQTSFPDAKALRVALAAGAVAGLVVIAACTESSAPTITAPTLNVRTATTSSGGFAYQGKILVCVNGTNGDWALSYDSTGVHPSYGFSVLNNFPNAGGWPGHLTNGDGVSHGDGTITGGSITAGSCTEVYTVTQKANVGDADTDAFARLNIRIAGPAGATLVSTVCDIDFGLANADGTPYTTHDGAPASPPNTDFYPDCDNDGDAKVWGNIFHGTKVTFTFSNPVSTGIIAPTATTCADYRDGKADPEPGIFVGLKNGVINNAAPGVFFFYSHVNIGSTQTIGFNQTMTSSAGLNYLYAVQQTQAYLYNQACQVVATLPLQSNGTLSSGVSMPAGNYIMGVKFTTDNAKGKTPSSITTPLATHNYWATVGGVSQGSTAASINTSVK
jgi:hypothetical protein